MTSNKTLKQRLDVIKRHTEAWQNIYDTKIWELTQSFENVENEPLSNNTAVVCTAALIEVIQEAANYLGGTNNQVTLTGCARPRYTTFDNISFVRK